MKIRVNPHNVEIVKEQTEPINELEIKISKCEFEFDEAITSEFVKEAYFTLNGSTYKQIIVNNECDYPSEVLTEKGTLEIGVVAFKVENGEEIIRYNPSPDYFESWVGSLKDAENSEPITPSEMEQFEQELQDGLNDIEKAIENAERLDIDVSKEDNITTVSITKKDGTPKSVEILDGEKGEKGDKGDKPIKGIDYFTPSDIESLNIPSKTSDLINDSGFINNSVNNLVNYYNKNEIDEMKYIVIEDTSNYENSLMTIDTTDNRNDVLEIYNKYKDLKKPILLEIKNEFSKFVLIPIKEIAKETNKLILKFDYVSNVASQNYNYKRMIVKSYKISVNFNNDEISTISGVKDLMYEYPLTSSMTLSTTNTSSYTPTGDYNPATKKYVDDSINNAIYVALNSSY